MEPVIIITVMALLQFMWFGLEVGSMRSRHGINGPAVSGHPEFERRFRIHLNTLEQLIAFLPALWIFAHMVDPLWAAGFGIVFLVGRLVYRVAYFRDPPTRGVGFVLTILPTTIMMVWVLIVAIGTLL